MICGAKMARRMAISGSIVKIYHNWVITFGVQVIDTRYSLINVYSGAHNILVLIFVLCC